MKNVEEVGLNVAVSSTNDDGIIGHMVGFLVELYFPVHLF